MIYKKKLYINIRNIRRKMKAKKIKKLTKKERVDN